MTSHNFNFIDVIGTLCHVALKQNRKAVFIKSVEVIFIEQQTSYSCDPVTKQLFCVIEIYRGSYMRAHVLLNLLNELRKR